jgi:hypothetical protein
VQLRCARAQRPKLTLQSAQLGDPSLDIGVAVVDQVRDHTAGRLARVAHSEHLTNFGQRQPDRLGRPDEGQAVNGFVAIRPISRLCAAWLG